MHPRFAVLFAAGSVMAVGILCSKVAAQIRPPAPAIPATQPVPGATDVPVKEIVLFSSGVGYFEHFGSVKGDAVTELRFKTDQINDVLKSLLLQDMDGGKIGTVSYPGQSPIEHTLKSFQIDITANPNMAQLLNQLRGAKLSVSLGGDNKLSGTILGVEKKLKTEGEKETIVEAVFLLNLKVGRQFRTIRLDQIQSMELEDPKLQKELDEALEALALSRDQDKKPMTLHFQGHWS